MAVSTKPSAEPNLFSLPNQLTMSRLVLAIVLFVLLSYELFFAGLCVFFVASSTDWLDGYYARKYGMVTVLGRILDPFVDKVIVCGTFVYLAAFANSGVRPWMTVVIVGRELLVTALRSFLEQRGGDFSAQMSGKLKMVLQCLAAGVSIFVLHLQANNNSHASDAWLTWLLATTVWGAVLLTIYSGAIYVRTAIRLVTA